MQMSTKNNLNSNKMKTKNILRTFLAVAFVLGTWAIDAQTKIYINRSNGTLVEYNIADIDSITFTGETNDYSKLKINEVSGVGSDSQKFYELINTGTKDINLAGCKIYYNANGSSGGTLPVGDGSLTWTGSTTHVAPAGGLLSLIGRNTTGSFSTGLTAARILIITLKDPDGNIIDQCIRAKDTDEYAFTDKSFSRIPDGTGPFYFTTPTPNVMNGTNTENLVLVPETP